MPLSPPPPPTRRTLRVNVRLSLAERAALDRKAALVGLPVSAYVREVGLRRVVRARRRQADRAALAEVARIANNLRQLRRVALESGDEEMAFELDRVHEELRELADRIVGTFAGG